MRREMVPRFFCSECGVESAVELEMQNHERDCLDRAEDIARQLVLDFVHGLCNQTIARRAKIFRTLELHFEMSTGYRRFDDGSIDRSE